MPSEPDFTLRAVQEVVEQHFPNLWPAVEAGLSTCATLLLADNVNPVALIYVGPSSAGKTTVASMFEGAQANGELLCYRTDKFTPASFVTQSAKATKQEISKIDLLPRIKHKVLLTPELSPIFRGKSEELADRFSIITRVLDGQGLITDSGTHGQRGYTGDYLFAWIGATTPFDDNVWRTMAQLGSRMFFLVMEGVADPTVPELAASFTKPISHQQAVKECQRVVHQFLAELFQRHIGVQKVVWNQEDNPKEILEGIAALAKLLAIMRTPKAEEGFLQPESPHRANAVLYNFARGHALISGRSILTHDDLSFIATIALSSMPAERRYVIQAFANNNGQPLTVSQVQEALGVKSRHTAERVMEGLDQLGVMTFEKEGNGKASQFSIRPEWDWCMAGDFRSLILQGLT